MLSLITNTDEYTASFGQHTALLQLPFTAYENEGSENIYTMLDVYWIS